MEDFLDIMEQDGVRDYRKEGYISFCPETETERLLVHVHFVGRLYIVEYYNPQEGCYIQGLLACLGVFAYDFRRMQDIHEATQGIHVHHVR